MAVLELDTPHGPARAHVEPVQHARAALVLGHGAGGGVDTPDLRAAAAAARSAGLGVALVEQPYRVAGRRSQAPARQLDAAWTAVVEQLRAGALRDLPLIAGGRSAGARVACRTAGGGGRDRGDLPRVPGAPAGQGRRPRQEPPAPSSTRSKVPALVVQGERDPFGMPPEAPGRTVVHVPGDHALRSAGPVGAAVSDWLAELGYPAG